MKKDNKLNGYLRFHYVVEDDPDVLQKFIRNPSQTLQQLGLTEDSLKCPDVAHRALERAEEVCKRIKAVEDAGQVKMKDLPKIVDIVERVFGKDFKVSDEPFGIRFSERVKQMMPEVTGTGTVSGTFGFLDNVRGDVDR